MFSENKGADQLRDYREAQISVFVFAYAKSLVSHDVAHLNFWFRVLYLIKYVYLETSITMIELYAS